MDHRGGHGDRGGAPPPNAANFAQARALAERAAQVGAVRKVVETVIVTREVIRNEGSGFVQGAQVINRRVNPDGSVEVRVGLKLTGDLLTTRLPKEPGRAVPLIIPLVPGPADPASPPAATPAAPAPQASAAAVYTGLIVDARGMGVRPAMGPTIRNEDGREIYGSAYVNRLYAIEQGMPGYLKDLSAAERTPVSPTTRSS